MAGNGLGDGFMVTIIVLNDFSHQKNLEIEYEHALVVIKEYLLTYL